MNLFKLLRARIVFSLLLWATLSLFFQQNLFAQAPPEAIATNEGMLTIGTEKGNDCYECQGLYLNGKELLHDRYVSIAAAYPSFQNPQLVKVSSSGGGSCCPPVSYVLDFSVTPHLLLEMDFGNDISRSANGVVFTQHAGTNEFGDDLLGVYEYVWGSGKPDLKKKTPQYTRGPISQKKSPQDVLGDPIVRAPLVKLMGAKQFALFRHYTAIAPEELNISDNHIIAGSGCVPHACTSQFGLFVIDSRKKLAWAVEGEDDLDGQRSGRLWGVLSASNPVPRDAIRRWLSHYNIAYSTVTSVPLAPALAQEYASRSGDGINGSPPPVPDKSGKIAMRAEAAVEQHTSISPVVLFKTLASSIFIVTAIRDNGDAFQGSAVAVSPTVLLTNCHVVGGSSSIALAQGNAKLGATLISADVDADRCILQSERPLGAFAPIRPYDGLNIGERVYSIGAPAGLELTMSDGLLSGKRTLSGRRLVQTTAPISHGSSGGGLFDEAGNLIGITTFFLKDSENLNFAISAEDYLRR
jgi:Trypsin-like peptidase domain